MFLIKKVLKLLNINDILNNITIELFYDNYWNLDYITDNKTNIYFFHYNKDNKLIKKINDIYDNEINFYYLKIWDINIIEKINYWNKSINFWINDDGKLNLLWENKILFEMKTNDVVYNINNEIIINNPELNIKYKKWLDWNLYLFLVTKYIK